MSKLNTSHTGLVFGIKLDKVYICVKIYGSGKKYTKFLSNNLTVVDDVGLLLNHSVSDGQHIRVK